MQKLVILISSSDHPEVCCETHPDQGQGGRAGTGKGQAERKAPVTQLPCPARMQMNRRLNRAIIWVPRD